MYYLNYHNALWDCFGFHIAQTEQNVAESGTGGGGGLTYESDVRVPPSTSDVGVFR